MASELEEQKKLILPYAQRAEEIKSVNRKIAYYCRLFAVDQGLRIERARRCKEIDELLAALLKQLERDKPHVTLDKENDKFYCEEFALKVFSRADRVDRAGKADVNTAVAYYAASVFLDILNQFGDIDAELLKQQKYALWRAAEIRKAIREGRQPQQPPVDESSAFLPAPAAQPGPGQDSAAQQFQPNASSPWQAFDSLPNAAVTAQASNSTSAAGPIPGLSPHPAYPQQPAESRPCRFPPGTRVLYCVGQGIPPEVGTVGKVNPVGDTYTCMVALRDQFVESPEEMLALDASAGSDVLFISPEGQTAQAWVLACMTSQWPPQYLLRLTDTGREVPAQPTQVAASAGASKHTSPATTSAPAYPANAPSGQDGMPPIAPPTTSCNQYNAPTRPHVPPQPTHSAWHPSMDPPSTTPTPMIATTTNIMTSAMPSTAYTPAATPESHHSGNFKPSLEAISEAHKQAKYAVSSLAFDDSDNAVKYLRKALELLTGSRS